MQKKLVTLVWGGAVLCSLSGCLTDGIESLTRETRDEVRATRDGTQTIFGLETCLNPEVSLSARVAACKSPILNLPQESRLADWMGIPLRDLGEESRKLVLEDGAEIDIPNVMYVGENGEMDLRLALAATSKDLHTVLTLSVLQLAADLAGKAKLPATTRSDLEALQPNARRVIYTATAVLGAVAFKDLKDALSGLQVQYVKGEIGIMEFQHSANRQASGLLKVLPDDVREKGAEALFELGKSVRLEDREMVKLHRLNEMRVWKKPQT